MAYLSSIIDNIVLIAEADPLVNTITMGSSIDLAEKNLFPLVNIDIEGGAFNIGQTVEMNIVLEVLCIRDINKHETTDDKVYSNDNLVDNINTSIAIANRIWKNLLRNFNDQNITAQANPNFQTIVREHPNILDGVELTITVEVPDNEMEIC